MPTKLIALSRSDNKAAYIANTSQYTAPILFPGERMVSLHGDPEKQTFDSELRSWEYNIMKYRFGSKEWLAAAHGIFAQRASSVAQQGIQDKVSICEIYNNCPADLGWPNCVLAWSCVYEDGAIDFYHCERSDVAFKVIGDYAAFATLATFEIRGDPQRAVAFRQMVEQRLAVGLIKLEIGNTFSEPSGLELFHDVLARMTSIS